MTTYQQMTKYKNHSLMPNGGGAEEAEVFPEGVEVAVVGVDEVLVVLG